MRVWLETDDGLMIHCDDQEWTRLTAELVAIEKAKAKDAVVSAQKLKAAESMIDLAFRDVPEQTNDEDFSRSYHVDREIRRLQDIRTRVLHTRGMNKLRDAAKVTNNEFNRQFDLCRKLFKTRSSRKWPKDHPATVKLNELCDQSIAASDAVCMAEAHAIERFAQQYAEERRP